MMLPQKKRDGGEEKSLIDFKTKETFPGSVFLVRFFRSEIVFHEI